MSLYCGKVRRRKQEKKRKRGDGQKVKMDGMNNE